MSSLDVWLAIPLLALATILTRCSFFLFGHAVKLPEKVQHALRYAPAAALAAIVAPDLMLVDGGLQLSLLNEKLVAGVGAGVFFLITRHLLWTIVAGMTLFTALRIGL